MKIINVERDGFTVSYLIEDFETFDAKGDASLVNLETKRFASAFRVHPEFGRAIVALPKLIALAEFFSDARFDNVGGSNGRSLGEEARAALKTVKGD